MIATDPITRASPTFQDAMRYPHKSGPAFQVFTRKPFAWRKFASAAGFWIGAFAFVGFFLSVRG